MVWYFYLKEQPPYEMNEKKHSPTLSTLVTLVLFKHNFGTHTIKGNIIIHISNKRKIFSKYGTW